MILSAVTLALCHVRQIYQAGADGGSGRVKSGLRGSAQGPGGVKEWKILWLNVFPNSLLPLLTMLGLSMGSLLGGTAVVEVDFYVSGNG